MGLRTAPPGAVALLGAAGGVILLLAALSPADAALLSRAGGVAVYDTDRNITWLANANLATSRSFGVPGISTTFPGAMSWDTAQAWLAALNAVNGGAGYLGVSTWRLPTTAQPDPSCSAQYDAGPLYGLWGEGSGCLASEMGHLANAEGVRTGTIGPFTNVQIIQSSIYWSGTVPPSAPLTAWSLRFDLGQQARIGKGNLQFAWPVADGDPLNVPAVDTDGDGVLDALDNCTLVPNPSQLDTNGDGYGNACDGDLDNNGTVTATDFALLRSVLGQPASFSALAAAADLDGNGTVTATDFALLRAALGKPPGPSGLHPNCPPTCP